MPNASILECMIAIVIVALLFGVLRRELRKRKKHLDETRRGAREYLQSREE